MKVNKVTTSWQKEIHLIRNSFLDRALLNRLTLRLNKVLSPATANRKIKASKKRLRLVLTYFIRKAKFSHNLTTEPLANQWHLIFSKANSWPNKIVNWFNPSLKQSSTIIKCPKFRNWMQTLILWHKIPWFSLKTSFSLSLITRNFNSSSFRPLSPSIWLQVQRTKNKKHKTLDWTHKLQQPISLPKPITPSLINHELISLIGFIWRNKRVFKFAATFLKP